MDVFILFVLSCAAVCSEAKAEQINVLLNTSDDLVREEVFRL